MKLVRQKETKKSFSRKFSFKLLQNNKAAIFHLQMQRVDKEPAVIQHLTWEAIDKVSR